MPSSIQPTDCKPLKMRIPSGHRAVYVAVPEGTFNYAKAQAYLSGMKWSEYVTRLLAEGKPFLDSRPAPPST
jgi:hypothetical protein